MDKGEGDSKERPQASPVRGCDSSFISELISENHVLSVSTTKDEMHHVISISNLALDQSETDPLKRRRRDSAWDLGIE